MESNIVSLMVSADWHIGAIDPYRFKDEILNLTKDTIKERGNLDLFIVAGDTFDMKEYLSSDSVKVFFLIMSELLELTKDYNTQFRFIEGTRTHDALQLNTLSIIFDTLLEPNRVKFIEEVSIENIFGLNILYLPEEYIIDPDTYYKDFFNKKYDFIFGHGNTDLMWYMTKHKQVNTNVFDSNELSMIARYSYFGHFHYRVEGGIDNRFKSIGTVSRWEFGKEGDCGLYYIEYDKSTEVAFEEYIPNIYAPILPTVVLTINNDYDLENLNKKIIKKINSVKDNADRVRLIINIDSSLQNFIMMRDFIMSSYGNAKELSLLIKVINKEDNIENEDVSSTIDSIEEKPYLYDKNMQDEMKIASYIKRKEGINISVESILGVIKKGDMKISLEG
jgi:hypothetical protein